MVTLGVEFVSMLDRLTEVLDDYSPVTQQKLIELLAARHAMRCGSENVSFVIDSMHKHIHQLAAMPNWHVEMSKNAPLSN
jgi:hypothetical protein